MRHYFFDVGFAGDVGHGVNLLVCASSDIVVRLSKLREFKLLNAPIFFFSPKIHIYLLTFKTQI
jgi:hypothetical protein